MTAPSWIGRAPSLRPHLVVVAPHPDDEVFSAGGLMRWASDLGANVEIVALTDGENSHAASTAVTPQQLVRRRAAERVAALSRLELSRVPIRRLGLPDGSLSEHEEWIQSLLMTWCNDETVLVVPPPADGHPDHDAAGRVALMVAERTGAGCWFVPIWSRVAGSAQAPTAVLDLHEFRRDKRASASCFASQLVPIGPGRDDGPVVHPHEAAALLSRTEHIVEAVA